MSGTEQSGKNRRRGNQLGGNGRGRTRNNSASSGSKRRAGLFVWLAPLVLVAVLLWSFLSSLAGYRPIDTSDGLAILSDSPQSVQSVTVVDRSQRVELDLTEDYTQVAKAPGERDQNMGRRVQFTYTEAQAEQVNSLVQQASPAGGYNSVVPTTSWLSSLVQLMLPMVLFLLLMWFVLRRMMGDGAGPMNFGRTRAQVGSKEMPEVTFADVAGEDEAVEELQEIREFLAEPEKFLAVGAKIPKGVLLYGPPGTGKTLLAKAIAGEANVPFFSMSGSEFVEAIVGMGASRMRDLFEQAKASAPAIIFVDEIDAIGGRRGNGLSGADSEREQTLNQLLVELDGFDASTNVILIAATNRPDNLDPALLRPGRFDRQVAVEAPDMAGRAAILRVHAQGKPMTDDVDLDQVAKRTPGFTGADLANVLNEAALLTARSNAQLIDNRALDEAIDRVIAGPQKRTRVMNDHEKAVTAYHEAGHAICAAAGAYSDPVTKVTILPRGRALGYTMVMPSDDKYSTSRNELLDQLVYAMGGRAAEELVFRDPTTGASNDIEKASATARRMVMEYGMSRTVGAVKLSGETGPYGQPAPREYSDELASAVDEEVRELMDTAHREAWDILVRNRAVLETLATELLEKETLLESDLERIFAGLERQPERPLWSSDDALQLPTELAEGNYFSASRFPRRGPGRQEEGVAELSSAEPVSAAQGAVGSDEPGSQEGEAHA